MKSRTWLFAPGHEARKLTKALESDADVVIADWEDAVSPDRKSEARRTTHQILTTRTRRHGRTAVRINGVATSHHLGDLEALRNLAVDLVMLPKAEDATAVRELGRLGIGIVPLVETALGIESLPDVVKAHPLVERLAFGTLDFALDTGCSFSSDGEAFLYARSRLVIASRVAGLAQPIDGIHPMLDDDAGLRSTSRSAKRLGFGGKLVIHPKQLPIVQQEFSPSLDDVRRAQRVLEEANRAQAQGSATARVGDLFIDRPMILWAQSVLED